MLACAHACMYCSMKRSRPTMAARSWLHLLCLAAATNGVLQARAQPDSKGFISIDCGLPGNTSYADDITNLSYVADDGFTDAGTNHNISPEYINPKLARRYYNVRSFPDGVRNCYMLRSLVSRLKYLIRATFLYGDYDGVKSPPVFEVHIGVNFWSTVNISSPGLSVLLEAIVVVPDDFVQVCLVNTGAGTPFISGLDLRPLEKSHYPQMGNGTKALVLLTRFNFGPTDGFNNIRYPDDAHDRIWVPRVNPKEWTEISTTRKVQYIGDDLFEAPSAVMQTGITPRNTSENIEFSWNPYHEPNNPSPGYVAIMHFSELQLLPSNARREFYINLNGKLLYPSGFSPDYLYANASNNIILAQYTRYDVSINATDNSTLPPIINAMEVFSIIATTNIGTDNKDVSAITAIKAKYQVKKNWMGDPCAPKMFVWDSLTCSYDISSSARITRLNLSFSELSGDISSSFANLKAIQYLDLSNNNLIGPIPDALSQLPSLTVLDVSENQLNGSIPSGLLKRIQDGSLNVKYDNNPNLCTNGNSCPPAKKKSKLAIYIIVVVVLVVVIVSVVVLLFCLLKRKRQGSIGNSTKSQNDTTSYVSTDNSYKHNLSLKLENRRFTYEELKAITNNFQRVLGRGGFGYVYEGFLEDGIQVAVKLRSQSSNQGVKEFLAEAQILTRIHHKNLVSMIGYCKDGEYMALVYEYMSEGTLQEHIAGQDRSGKYLTWRQRLRIAMESAQGLEYLHKGCNPPLIHRDVKATNILLNERLEAKIADFGLSKAFNHDNSHVSTNTIVGTPGYVDPEYMATMQPTIKSDVYSFGVVLLELVTGKPAILRDPEPSSIIHWAQQRLARGNIEGVVDARMQGSHDVNGVWKAADIALKCTTQVSTQRPSMTDVVALLQDCLKLEDALHDDGDRDAGFYANNDTNSNYSAYEIDRFTNGSQSNNLFEMEHNVGRAPTMNSGPVAR